ncbi:MAG: potassium channel family protein [Alphaproteobacteria bacterium]
MVVAIVLAVAMVVMTAALHYYVLQWLSGGMARIPLRPGPRVLSIVFVILATHIIQVVLYALAYGASIHILNLGTFGGLTVERPLDFLYFSIVTYTSLGLGDVFPTGHLRFLAGVEALNGLLLIAWSGSFIFLAMGRLWPWQSCVEPSRRRHTGA